MRLASLVIAGLALLSSAAVAGPLSNRRAPGFALPDVNFNYHDLYDYRGKVVLLEIMRTDCPVCNVFPRVIEKVRTKFGAKVQVLTIVIPPDSTQTVGQFIARHNIKTPILFDMGQATASYMKATPQTAQIPLPQLFVIDGNGWTRNDYVYGGGTEAIFENGDPLIQEIEAILADMQKGGKGGAPKAAPTKPAAKAPAKSE
jgi:peroxiredoxin